MMIFIIRMENCSVIASCPYRIKAGPWCPFVGAAGEHIQHSFLCCSTFRSLISKYCWKDLLQWQHSVCYCSSIVWQSMYTNPLGMCFAKVLTPKIRFNFWMATNLVIYERKGGKENFSHLYFSAVNQNKHTSLGTIFLAFCSAAGPELSKLVASLIVWSCKPGKTHRSLKCFHIYV